MFKVKGGPEPDPVGLVPAAEDLRGRELEAVEEDCGATGGKPSSRPEAERDRVLPAIPEGTGGAFGSLDP